MIAFIHSSEPAPDIQLLSRVRRWSAAVGIDAVVVDPSAAAAADPGGAAGGAAAVSVQTVFAPASADRPRAVFVESAGATASTLRSCRSLLGGDAFLVLDVAKFEEFDLRGLVAEHASSPAIATLLLRPATGSTAERRVEVDRTGRVLRLTSGESAPELALAAGGVALIEPELLQHVPAAPPMGLEDGLFPLVLRRGGILSGWRIPDVEASGLARAPVRVRS